MEMCQGYRWRSQRGKTAHGEDWRFMGGSPSNVLGYVQDGASPHRIAAQPCHQLAASAPASSGARWPWSGVSATHCHQRHHFDFIAIHAIFNLDSFTAGLFMMPICLDMVSEDITTCVISHRSVRNLWALAYPRPKLQIVIAVA